MIIISREVEGELMQPRHGSESVTKFLGKEDKEISTQQVRGRMSMTRVATQSPSHSPPVRLVIIHSTPPSHFDDGLVGHGRKQPPGAHL